VLCVRANQHLWLLPGLIHAYKCHARRNLLLFFPDNRLAALRHGQLEPLHLAKSSAPLHQLPRLALFTASRPSLSLFSALRVVSVPSHTCISLWLCPRQSIKRWEASRPLRNTTKLSSSSRWPCFSLLLSSLQALFLLFAFDSLSTRRGAFVIFADRIKTETR
jgi:hypothetical protein